MASEILYAETLTSSRTQALFAALAAASLGGFVWRWAAVGPDGWAWLCAALLAFFLFYAWNFRKLRIQLTPAGVALTFGVFVYRIAGDNIAGCAMDATSLWRIGGAGIHFSFFDGRYRAMFNFLEHPRVIITLKRKQGPVCDVAFSTRRPDDLLQTLATLGQRHTDRN